MILMNIFFLNTQNQLNLPFLLMILRFSIGFPRRIQSRVSS